MRLKIIYTITEEREAEGKIISAILIMIGPAMILSFISSFGATLVESRLKNRLRLSEESRTLIKEKIDQLKKLEHDDIDTLTSMIKSLQGKLQKDSKAVCSCSKCGNISTIEAAFCSKCGTTELQKPR